VLQLGQQAQAPPCNQLNPR